MSLIALDKAHLVSDWSDFRKAYLELRNLKYTFPDVPITALTAKAMPRVEQDIKKLLRNPPTFKAYKLFKHKTVCFGSKRVES